MVEGTKTYKIRIWGVVQGVGFRPFTAKLAEQMQLKGEVKNMGGLVEIIMTDSNSKIKTFIERLLAQKPEPAKIVNIEIQEIDYRKFEEFKIVDSTRAKDHIIMLPPDMAVCGQCEQDTKNPKDRRYRHPFVSCMLCGPRYTIIDSIPYDRENTAMRDFFMCGECQKEYTDRADRRYHAQTISCHDCGPILLVENSDESGYKSDCAGQSKGVSSAQSEDASAVQSEDASAMQSKDVSSAQSEDANAMQSENASAMQNEAVIATASDLLKKGRIIALKGIGGYYFVCSATDDKAVKKLRQLKGREEKPFAVMFRDIDQIKEHCMADEAEEKLLHSGARPIVLLTRLKATSICQEVYRSSRYIGAFLPSMALQTMLIERSGILVMTSANISDAPIIKDDEEILKFLNDPLLSAVVYHKRSIRVRVDDSVVRVIEGQSQITRRSKGYVPTPIYIGGSNKFDSAKQFDSTKQLGVTKQFGSMKQSDHHMILALGGQLKSAFCLTKGLFAYVSQYFGDLDSTEAIHIYKENIERLKQLFEIDPHIIACDCHPGYYTSELAQKLAESTQNDRIVSIMYVQHHHAHIASVMAENGLTEPVIGVSFDGTGYGEDGAIWGGEFLICTDADYERAAHLDYTSMLGGDSSMRQGWKSAMCYLHRQPENVRHPYRKDERYQIVSKALDANVNTINSSSMGRLFDAAAALSYVHEENRYEGECAAMLESCAAQAIDEHIEPVDMRFSHVDQKNSQMADIIIDPSPVISALIGAVNQGRSKAAIALGFHQAVAKMICDNCILLRDKTKINKAALSGGVFQNKVLMELTLPLLRRAGFEVYYNISVPPNDGGICLGQAYVAYRVMRKSE